MRIAQRFSAGTNRSRLKVREADRRNPTVREGANLEVSGYVRRT